MPSATHALGCKKYIHVNLTSLNLIHLTYPRKQFKTYNKTCKLANQTSHNYNFMDISKTFATK